MDGRNLCGRTDRTSSIIAAFSWIVLAITFPPSLSSSLVVCSHIQRGGHSVSRGAPGFLRERAIHQRTCAYFSQTSLVIKGGSITCTDVSRARSQSSCVMPNEGTISIGAHGAGALTTQSKVWCSAAGTSSGLLKS